MTQAIATEKLIAHRPKSQQYFDELCKLIPGGTNSPVRSFKGLGIPPMIAEKGIGDLVHDIDGNTYIDFCGSWGPLIHGHSHPEILAVAQAQLFKGTTFGITSSVEKELASIIIKNVPSVKKIRFVSSGTEATMSAARLARGFTGRDLIVKFSGHYHGHADFFLVQAGSGVFGINPASSSAGIPDDIVRNTACLTFNDFEGCKNFLLADENRDKIACVILEPIAGNMGCVPAKPEFLKMLRDTTREIGALLIFDEVMTGFRVALGGAQQLYGIEPDLTCFAKIIGGGFPAAAFGGREDIMNCLAPLGSVYQAGTLSGNPVAMAAGHQALQMLERQGAYEELQSKTDLLIQPIREMLNKKNHNACIQSAGSMFTLFFGVREVRNMDDAKGCDLVAFAKFFRYLFERGIYIPPMQYEAWFISLAHTEEHLLKTRDLILSYFDEIY
ncbi:MAG TPA: glutamate-1-semialdehyde 2,1-aminomutase [Parachlamydiaceae bacterium]|nr:glutamate-1-semialdehyde 2,1-aminomutase [Parachlamydiaceae bacterium]